MIVTDDRVARFVSEKLDFALCPPWTCMGLESQGEIIAGVLFNQFEGAGIHVTVAGHGWTRGFIEEVGRYVFGQLGCARMTITTQSETVAAMAVRCGGEREGLLRSHFGPGRNGIIVGILREDWRWGNVAHQ